MHSTGVVSSDLFNLSAISSTVFNAACVFRLCFFYLALIWQTQVRITEARPSLRPLASSSLSSSALVATVVAVSDNHHHSRRKRRWITEKPTAAFLAAEKEAAAAQQPPVVVTGSVDNSSKNSRKPRNISPSPYEQIFRRRQLYFRTGFHLQIHPDSTVNGTREDDSRFGILDLMPIMAELQVLGPQRIAILGVESRQYLCMNNRGQLYGSKVKSDECEFTQTMEKNYYETWSSTKYPKKKLRKNGKKTSNKRWYIALGRDGNFRSGRKSRRTQKSAHLLTRPVTQARYAASNANEVAKGSSFSSSSDNLTLLPTNFKNKISLDGSSLLPLGLPASSSSSSSSSSSEKVVIVVGDSSSPLSSSSTLKDLNRVEPNAELQRSRGRTRSHKKQRGRRRKKLAARRRKRLLYKQLKKQLLQQRRKEITKQVNQIFTVHNP